MTALHRRLLAGCLVLLIAGRAVGDEPRKDRSKAPATPPTKEQLDKLLKLYRSYELPEPPADAALIRVKTGGRTIRDGIPADHIALGFLIKAMKSGTRDQAFWPTGQVEELHRRRDVTLVEPTPAALTGVNLWVDSELAVLCHSRGWNDLALKIAENPSWDLYSPPEAELARHAWYHWCREFEKPNSDRAKVARLLKRAVEASNDGEVLRDLKILDALEASLIPGSGKSGTVEAMIDQLVDVNCTDQTHPGREIVDLHPAYLAVARKGFDAVPTLLEHLNDERLTRARDQQFSFPGAGYNTVADVVIDLLHGLAGADARREWTHLKRRSRLRRADIEEWWATAQKTGEEAYLVEHVLDDSDEGNLKNTLMADVFAHKYPKRLQEVYRRMLKERPKMDGSELGAIVVRSSLPKGTKRELFLEAATSKSAHVRGSALELLLKVDRAEAVRLLLLELDRLAAPPDDRDSVCSTVILAWVAIHANDPGVWAALEKVAKRVDAKRRVEFLSPMVNQGLPPETRTARLRFVGRFLDDATVREAYGGTEPKIEVRNYVAGQLIWVFDLDVEPNSDWTDEQWAELREDVKKALAREGIR